MKQSRYELTAAARVDLLEIWNFLAEWESLDVADQVLQDIETALEHLVLSPQVGHPRRDLTKRKLLFYTVHSYLIIYRPQTMPLVVIRVLHGARDVGTLLKEDA